jgi:hypothetical protein
MRFPRRGTAGKECGFVTVSFHQKRSAKALAIHNLQKSVVQQRDKSGDGNQRGKDRWYKRTDNETDHERKQTTSGIAVWTRSFRRSLLALPFEKG